ncbi:hypothetical protein [Thioclava sp. GXIMD2076]|uniref:Uncharacterized protein n=1 Tax=Thioclava kandeliae TaxID=3070818 RepID=A0ABV1SLG9_9RHOB
MKDDSALGTESVAEQMPDRLLAYALDALLTREAGWVGLVPELAQLGPEADPTDIAIALTRAATEIEQSFVPSSPSMDAARHGYKLAALLLLEMKALALQGIPVVTCAELLAIWRETPFLDPA